MSCTVGSESIKQPLSKSDLNKKSLCDYVVNVATGCLHGCTFCYVPSTLAIKMRKQTLAARGVVDAQLNWGEYLFLRPELPGQLDATLQRKRRFAETPSGKGVVLLCSGTDPYQTPRVAAITRQTIVVMLKHNLRIRILTRSPLWIKDLDILCHPNVTVGMSIPHLNDELSRQVEPGAPRPSDRLKAIGIGKQAGCRIYIAMAPTPPPSVLSHSDLHDHLDVLSEYDPETIFWEPINARGTNLKLMTGAGLTWASEVSSGRDWADNFFAQWEAILGASEAIGYGRLHIWADPGLKKYNPPFDCDSWFYRPTLENWR